MCLLAVLKAGAGYLPLDPDYPADRISFMLHDAKPSCVLTNSEVEIECNEALKVLVDDVKVIAEVEKYSEDNIDEVERIKPLSPLHIAYVIYTSGSTGRPKGVMIPHQNVVRLLGATDHWFQFDGNDVWTMFHSYAFDFGLGNLGTFIIRRAFSCSPTYCKSLAERILQLLVKEKVTVLNQTPSAFYQLMQADRENEEIGQKLSLRYVVLEEKHLS